MLCVHQCAMPARGNFDHSVTVSLTYHGKADVALPFSGKTHCVADQGPDQGPDRRADACPYSGTNSDADTKPHACSSLLLQLENDEVRARRHETSACLGGVQQGVPARDVWRVQRSHWPVQGVRIPPDHLQH